MTDYSLMNKKDGKTFKGAHAESRGARLVFEERVDLELSVGFMAPVHPLGGHLRFLQDDEKS